MIEIIVYTEIKSKGERTMKTMEEVTKTKGGELDD